MTARCAVLMGFFGLICLQAEIVDRIAATVAKQVIAESEVMEELRVTAFLEALPADASPDAKRKALDRLIDQNLMRREIVFTRFPLPSQSDLDPLYKQVLERFPARAAYLAELARYGLTDSDIRAHLQWQLMTLRFIEYRFQHGVQLNEADIQREYDGFVRKWREEKHTDPPPFDQVHADMEKLARQALVDSALDRWLGEVRTQNDIIYHKGYEQ